MSKEGYLRHVLIRRARRTGEIIIAIVTTTTMDVDFKILCDRLLELNLLGDIVGIMHIYNDGLADMVRSDKTEILYGRDYIYEEILGLKFKISLFSFFQTNSLGAEKLYEKAREYVGETKDKLVFDLYSGTGTITQMLAKVAKKVVGVEIIEEAVDAAKENADLNGLENCDFYAGDVLKVIDEIEDKPDLIVLDPPRDGINPHALDKIINYGKYSKEANYLIGYGVIFPECIFTGKGNDLVTEVVYDGKYEGSFLNYLDDTLEYWASEEFIKHGVRHNAISDSDLRRLNDLIRGDFCVVPSMSVQIEHAEKTMLKLTEEQYDVLIDTEENDRNIIRGVAGTGKTVLALELARSEMSKNRNIRSRMCIVLSTNCIAV